MFYWVALLFIFHSLSVFYKIDFMTLPFPVTLTVTLIVIVTLFHLTLSLLSTQLYSLTIPSLPPFYLASLIPSLPLIPFLAFTLTLLLLRLTHYVILTFTHTLPLNRMLLLLTEPIQHSIQYKYPSQFLFSR